MKFTREQFDEIGKFYTDDLNINDGNQDFMFEVFNLLPNDLQGQALECGFNESLTREHIFEYLVETLHDMSLDEFYELKTYEAENLPNEIVLQKLIEKQMS